jgi:hypothetical protein
MRHNVPVLTAGNYYGEVNPFVKVEYGENLIVPCEKHDTSAAVEKFIKFFFPGYAVAESVSVQHHKFTEEPQGKGEKSFFHYPTVKARIYTASPQTPTILLFMLKVNR